LRGGQSRPATGPKLRDWIVQPGDRIPQRASLFRHEHVKSKIRQKAIRQKATHRRTPRGEVGAAGAGPQKSHLTRTTLQTKKTLRGFPKVVGLHQLGNMKETCSCHLSRGGMMCAHVTAIQ
jgi:hypothetical protein